MERPRFAPRVRRDGSWRETIVGATAQRPAKQWRQRAKTFRGVHNRLYAAFVERGLEVLWPRGYLGAITSHTGLTLTTFEDWRKEIVLRRSQIHVLADLGSNVLDTAMVKTAAYALERVRS